MADVTYTGFTTAFPEFESIDQDIVEVLISNTLIELDFSYIESPKQEQAYYLAIAHYLQIAETSDPKKLGILKAVEDKNDRIEYAVNPVDASSWLSTTYGQRLQRLINQYINIGFGLAL